MHVRAYSYTRNCTRVHSFTMPYGHTKHPIIIRNLSETRINFIRKISNSVRFLRNLCDNCGSVADNTRVDSPFARCSVATQVREKNPDFLVKKAQKSPDYFYVSTVHI